MPLIKVVALLLMIAGQPVTGPQGASSIAGAIASVRTPPLLMLAIARHESGMVPGATGALGETGLWQIHPVNRRGKPKEYARMCRKPKSESCMLWHARMADRLMRKGFAVCGSLEGALAYYNRGHGCTGRPQYVRGVKREIRNIISIMKGHLRNKSTKI